MNPLLRSALAVAVLLLGGLSSPVAAETLDPAGQLIDQFDQTLVGVMKAANGLGYEGRYQALAPRIWQTFNVPLMTRIVAGLAWKDWDEAQRQTITEAFGKFIIATYARRFDGYSGEELVVDGEKPAPGGNGTLVLSRILRPKEGPVSLNYLIRPNDQGHPQVVDVFLTGTISELATRRSEFGAVIQRDGYQGLLKALEEKAEGGT